MISSLSFDFLNRIIQSCQFLNHFRVTLPRSLNVLTNQTTQHIKKSGRVLRRHTDSRTHVNRLIALYPTHFLIPSAHLLFRINLNNTKWLMLNTTYQSRMQGTQLNPTRHSTTYHLSQLRYARVPTCVDLLQANICTWYGDRIYTAGMLDK